MDLKDYIACNYTQQFQYKSFTPSKIDDEWTWAEPQINTLLAEANLKLGELNAFSLYVPDIDFFIKMHVVKEATTSSRIEGTKTEVEDVILKEEDVLPEKKDDWKENFERAKTGSVVQALKMPYLFLLINRKLKI